MYIQYGQRMFGKCDVVPELFWVGTFAFHINFVPLIPLGSHLVLGQQGESYRTVKIPFSFKSLLYAWARLAFFIAAVVMWILTIVAFNQAPHQRDINPGAAIAFAGLFTALYLFVMFYPRRVKPSYKRACELATLANFNERAWAALNVMYGRHPADRYETLPNNSMI